VVLEFDSGFFGVVLGCGISEFGWLFFVKFGFEVEIWVLR